MGIQERIGCTFKIMTLIKFIVESVEQTDLHGSCFLNLHRSHFLIFGSRLKFNLIICLIHSAFSKFIADLIGKSVFF